MCKILVTYSSKTGNTEKVAIAISEAIENSELLKMKDVKDINQYDGIVVGYWADKGIANKEAVEFLKKINNKKCGLFATLGAYPDSEHSKDVINYGIDVLENQGNEILATFICQGKIDPKLTEMFKSFPEGHPHYMDEARRKRHEDASTHPDENDLKNSKIAFQNFKELIESR